LKRVMAARAFMEKRAGDGTVNSLLAGDRLREDCDLTPAAADMLAKAFEKLGLSARAYDRVLRVARSIADLAAEKRVEVQHVSEAVQYRNLERKYWYTI
ncbi:ATP-binding protein, partial [Ruminococcaceae bacterium OttesenSCG-928-A11]|nr:ATP-binding protein [Ruminococcaceae bacterium OttesenSCG-928-A11]